MMFPFVLVGPDGHEVRRVRATDLATARAMLQPPEGHYVTSAASFAVPLPRALPSDRCVGCGRGPKAPRSDYCTGCTKRRRNARESVASEFRGATFGGKRARGQRGPDRAPRLRPAKTAKHRAAIARAIRAHHAARRRSA